MAGLWHQVCAVYSCQGHSALPAEMPFEVIGVCSEGTGVCSEGTGVCSEGTGVCAEVTGVCGEGIGVCSGATGVCCEGTGVCFELTGDHCWVISPPRVVTEWDSGRML